MKKVTQLGIAAALMASTAGVAFAKPASAQGFKALKQQKIQRLEQKMRTIEKRLACIKRAGSSSEIKECESRYPLKKSRKKSKKIEKKRQMKKEMKQKMEKKMEKKMKRD